MGKGTYGYSPSKIEEKAKKRGISPSGYIKYVELKQKRRSWDKKER